MTVVAVRYLPLTAWGRQFVERRLDGLDLGAPGRLGVRGLKGDIWSDFTVARMSILDRSGVWVESRDVHVIWIPSAILERRIEISSVASPEVTALRDPKLKNEPVPTSTRLPVAIQIDHAAFRVTLEPEMAVRRGIYDVAGNIAIDRSGATRGVITATSVLHVGDFLKGQFDVGRKDRLVLDIQAREARGGALSGALGFVADQPFSIDARARGRASAGHFSLSAKVGSTEPAQSSGTWDAAGARASGRFDLTASKRLGDLQSRIGTQVRFDLTGHAVRPGLYALVANAVSDNLRLNAEGQVDTERRVTGPNGIVISAEVRDMSKLSGSSGLGAGKYQGALIGKSDRWLLAGAGSIDHIAIGGYTLARLAGPIGLESQNGGLTLHVSARGAGGAGRGLAAALLGAAPSGTTEITRLSNGRTLIRTLVVDGAGVKVQAQGEQGILGGLAFRGEGILTGLNALRAGAHGEIDATWNAAEGSGADHWTFGFDAKGKGISTGSADLDQYVGASPRLTAAGNYAGGDLSVSKSTLTGAAGALSAVGLVGVGGALKLALDWRAEGPLALGPFDITGSARGIGALTGTLRAPQANLAADFAGVDMPGLSIRNGHLSLNVAKSAEDYRGHVSLAGASDYGPARASADFRLLDRGVNVGALEIMAAGITASGSLALRDDIPSTADLVVGATAGILVERGRVAAKIHIVDARGGPQATMSLTANDAVMRDGGVLFKTLAVSVDGPLKRMTYEAKGSGFVGDAPWRLAGTGTLELGESEKIVTFSGGGRFMRADIRTLDPARIVATSHGLDGRLRLASGNGTANVTIDKTAGALNASAKLANISLGVFDPDYLGRVDGTLSLTGRGNALAGTLSARLTGAGGRDMKGSPPLDGTLEAALQGTALTVVADLANTQGSKAHVDVVVPVDSSTADFKIVVDHRRPMSGHFLLDGEVRPLWDLGMGGGRSLSGHVRASGTIAGTVADPRAIGSASLEGGRFQDTDTGLKLEAIALAATLSDNGVDVTAFSGRDNGRGTLSGSGRINLARQGVSSFRLGLRSFRLIDNEVGQATATGVITVSRNADGKVQLRGDLAVDHAQIAPNPPVPSGVVPMDVVEVHKPQALDEAAAIPMAREAPVGLDIRLKAPGGVFIKGRGLNVELSLDARVSGNTDDPRLTGVAHVVRGDYDFAGRRFQFDDRGIVYLGSTPETIRLDLTASREDPTLTAVIKITGTAARPTVILSSTPLLPKDEVLSRVLFGASASQLSGLQAAQLASALSGLAGGGGFDIIGGLRNLAHLDRLAVSGDVATGTSVSGGKYLTDKIYIELSGGGRDGPGAQVEWRVRRHLALVSKVTSQGGSQISIRWRRN